MYHESMNPVCCRTFEYLAEAVLALEVIQEFKLPAVVTMSTLFSDGISMDGFSPSKSCDILKRHGMRFHFVI